MSDWHIVYRGIRAKAARRLSNKRTNITEVKADSEYLVVTSVQALKSLKMWTISPGHNI